MNNRIAMLSCGNQQLVAQRLHSDSRSFGLVAHHRGLSHKRFAPSSGMQYSWFRVRGFGWDALILSKWELKCNKTVSSTKCNGYVTSILCYLWQRRRDGIWLMLAISLTPRMLIEVLNYSQRYTSTRTNNPGNHVWIVLSVSKDVKMQNYYGYYNF